MLQSVLRPGDISATDSARVLSFLNAVADADALAETIGLSDGLNAGKRVAAEILAARKVLGRFSNLDQVLAVTGVTLARFTEIAMALSSAQPPLGDVSLRFTTTQTNIWLGLTAQITVQMTDSKGQGILDSQITCIASNGALTARVGLQEQSGSAISLRPELGGLVRLSLELPIAPALSAASKAALAAELPKLDVTAASPQEDITGLRQLAARYRGQAAAGLQTAVDQLFEAAPPPNLPVSSPWPVQPVTILALVHGDDGQVSHTATLILYIRNWLGGFYAALRDELRENSPLREALQVLTIDARAGRDLSRKLIQATQSFSALERGVIGRELRISTTGVNVNSFLEANADTLRGEAIVNTVRAAGASETAIASGGFAVFEAIRTVQDAGDVIAPGRSTGLDLDALRPFDNRLGVLEDTTLRRTDLTAFDRDLSTRFDARFDAIEANSVTTSDLDQLRGVLQVDFNSRIAGVENSRVSNDQFEAFRDSMRRDLAAQISTRVSMDEFEAVADGLSDRVAGIESNAVTTATFDRFANDLTRTIDERLEGAISRAELDAGLGTLRAETGRRLTSLEANTLTAAKFEELSSSLRNDLNAQFDRQINRDEFDTLLQDFEARFDDRLKQVERTSITDERLARNNADLRADVDAQIATRMTRDEFKRDFDALQADMSARLRTKANARTLADLRVSVDKVNELQTKLTRDVQVMDERVTRGGRGRIIR